MPEQRSKTADASRAAAQLRARVEPLVRRQTEAARQKARDVSAGGGVAFAGVALLGLAIPTAVAAVVAGIATVLDVWMAALIVLGALFILGGGLVATGIAMIKRATAPATEACSDPPTTTRAIADAPEPRRPDLPALAAAAFAAGFALSGGVGAIARTLMRRHYRRRAEHASMLSRWIPPS